MSGERGDRDLKRRRFFQILGEVDDSLIEEAEGAAPKKQGRGWLPWTALAACCLIVAGGVYWGARRPSQSYKENLQQGIDQSSPEIGYDDAYQTGPDADAGESALLLEQLQSHFRENGYPDYYGGSYLDARGVVVQLTEDSQENRDAVTVLFGAGLHFEKADYSYRYLSELLSRISAGMAEGRYPDVSDASLEESSNRIRVAAEGKAAADELRALDTQGNGDALLFTLTEGGMVSHEVKPSQEEQKPQQNTQASEVSARVKETRFTEEEQTVVLIIANPSDAEAFYGQELALELWDQSGWKPVSMRPEAAWDSLAYLLPAGSEQDFTVRLDYFYDQLAAGRYRLSKTVYCGDEQLTVAVEFEI